MKFIEISDGVSVRKEEIICVERMEETKSRVTTEYGIYDSNFPYQTILSLLEMENIEEKVSKSALPSNNLYPYQFFAG